MAIAEKAAGAVVVGVDGSEASAGALDWAAEQAVLEGRPLTVLHAGGTWNIPDLEIDPATVQAAMHAEGRAILQGACALVEERARVPELRSVLVTDDPRSALLDASDHAFLLVLGSRGRGPVKSLLMGSVGITLTQHARCTVVVRRPHHAGAGRAGVLVGVDQRPHSEPAVAWAFHQADLRSMPVTLLRTVFDGRPARSLSRDEPGHESHWAELEAVTEQFRHRHPAVEVHHQLRRGLPDEALVQAATDMDTVVVGTHVRRSVLGLLDLNVPKGVVEHAPCFVAVVPAPD